MIKIPEDRQAGAEIEATPEMIQAGFDVLLCYGRCYISHTQAAEGVLG